MIWYDIPRTNSGLDDFIILKFLKLYELIFSKFTLIWKDKFMVEIKRKSLYFILFKTFFL